MSWIRWDISAGAVLLVALLYFFDGSGIVSAAVPAVLVHESGHWLLLRVCGKRLTRVRVGLVGVELDYAGRLEGAQTLLCVAAGPLFGLVYALILCSAGGAWAELSGALSFVMSVFNLLPVLPLDGGRLISAITDDLFAAKLSRAASLILLLGGTAILLRFHSISMLLMSGWLTICNFRR